MNTPEGSLDMPTTSPPISRSTVLLLAADVTATLTLAGFFVHALTHVGDIPHHWHLPFVALAAWLLVRASGAATNASTND